MQWKIFKKKLIITWLYIIFMQKFDWSKIRKWKIKEWNEIDEHQNGILININIVIISENKNRLSFKFNSWDWLK